ncbi:MAG: M13 family metallopeptidase [bacterium]|nr:M13 family metallopeptidase [bacterium]
MFKNHKPRITLLALCLALFLTVACSTSKKEDAAAKEEKPVMTDAGQTHKAEKPAVKRKSLDPADMDTSVRPGDDFYRYANGNWLTNNPIPEDFSRWGTFEQLADQNAKDLKIILETAAKDENAPAGSNLKKIGDFYTTAMDEAGIEAAGLNALESELKQIADIKDKGSLQELTGFLHTRGARPLFNIIDSQDPGNSEMVIAWLFQGGMGLPDRDYYTGDTERYKTIRKEYAAHITKMFQLMKDSPEQAAKAAETVMALETRLAKTSMTTVEMRNPKATYNLKSIQELEQMTPDFDFNGYFKAIGLAVPAHLNVAQPKFFEEVNSLVKETGLEDLKTYFRWNLIRAAAPYLSSDFAKEDFRFNRGVLRGAKKMRPRWRLALSRVSGAMGEALGQVYVARHFPPEAKTRAYNMVASLREVLAERIKKLDWMSDVTKKRALEKLAAFKVKIGYPDKWIDYSNLEVKRDSYVKNALRAGMFNFKRHLDRIGKAPDRAQWGMSPQIVNAFYSPQLNEIVFPAAILQPPFFDFEADDAVNFGGIGSAIGHEMTHGFDDEGRQYDKDGNLKDWWTEEDAKRFEERAGQLKKQFDGYVAVDDVHVDGKLTLGENIADLGGMLVAFGGLEKSLQENPVGKIDGLTPQQRFFLAWARVWRNNIRKENLLMRLKGDPHSPGKFRSYGASINVDAFYDAFDIKEGDKIFKPKGERIRIW